MLVFMFNRFMFFLPGDEQSGRTVLPNPALKSYPISPAESFQV